jgi:hypothetical protein
MMKLFQIGVVALASLAGCASTTDVLNATQAAAVDTALKRARFEMACPAATGSVLSRQAVDPAIRMSRFGAGGPERYEYTVGVEGCGKRQTAVVICSDASPSDCFATGSRE